MHECGHVVGSLEDFGIDIAVNEVEQLIEYLFDIADLVQIGHNQGVLGQKLLLLLLKPLLKLILNLLLLILQFLLQIKETLINILHLLEFQPLQLLLHLL